MNAPHRKMHLVAQPDVEPEQRIRHYARVKPGTYTGFSRVARVYRDRPYGRWTCLLLFDLVKPESGENIARNVPMWFALGQGERPNVTRRSKYWAAWILANGGPPQRRERMSARVFRHRIARVEVCDTEGPAPYSKISAIVSWEGIPGTGT